MSTTAARARARRLRSRPATPVARCVAFHQGGGRMRIATRAVVGALVAGAFAAAPAQAQINYYTQGFFTSAFPGCGVPGPVVPVPGAPIPASCSGGGFTLNFIPKALNPGLIGSGSVVSLGNFQLTGSGDVSVSSGAVIFTLAIQQTDPTTGM